MSGFGKPGEFEIADFGDCRRGGLSGRGRLIVAMAAIWVAVGDFSAEGGACQLTLMIAEEIDPDVAMPLSAARLRLAPRPVKPSSSTATNANS